ncbi:MAG TPA: hypothetical protein VLE91_05010 [Candidatus Saccharimonadales bacterium]|nr:hypothetical protein [Candidatus Saccharimonadales bacterium]
MNPEVVSRLKEFRLKAPRVSETNPLYLAYTRNEARVLKRARWLLDFTDNHPLFYGHNLDDMPHDALQGNMFSTISGRMHRDYWTNRVKNYRPEVKRTAAVLANYGYAKIGETIAKIEPHPYKEDNFPQLDSVDALANYSVKSQLQHFAQASVDFKRSLSLINVISQSKDLDNDPDKVLAVFSALVGFAQVLGDRQIEQKNGNKGRKHTLRDQVLYFGFHSMDRGLAGYIAALNRLLV